MDAHVLVSRIGTGIIAASVGEGEGFDGSAAEINGDVTITRSGAEVRVAADPVHGLGEAGAGEGVGPARGNRRGDQGDAVDGGGGDGTEKVLVIIPADVG